MADVDETLQTYNRRPRELSEYFHGIGSRAKYIKSALELAGKSDGSADVLEIGCGDGRDAAEIVKRVRTYKGIDYSEGLIRLAKDFLPDTNFEISDMRSFEYPTGSYDVVFAFASLLHISKEEVRTLIKKIAGCLRDGGVFYLALKYAPEYKGEWREDVHGKRLFYYYNPETITVLSDGHLRVVDTTQSTVGNTQWFEMALQK